MLPVNSKGNLAKCWGVTCDGLASHPVGVAIPLLFSCYESSGCITSWPESNFTSSYQDVCIMRQNEKKNL